MNLLYDKYPDTVILNGREYGIVTEFKDWLRFVDMVKDDSLSDGEKVEIMLSFYLEEIPAAEQGHAHKPLEGFLCMAGADAPVYEDREPVDFPDEIPPGKPLYDFCFDARYIIAGFWHDYRIDLTTTDMHWWKFRILLDGLSAETEFKQRVMYRNTDTSQIKDTKERSRILRIQRKIAIPQPKPTDFEIGDLFC